jgi:predicted Rossmann fold nucleotide-binding protein DprA/Smf involved in DNA uptake
VEAERQRAQAERQRAEHAEAQVQQIAENLLRSQMPIAQVAQLTGLPTAQVEALLSHLDIE